MSTTKKLNKCTHQYMDFCRLTLLCIFSCVCVCVCVCRDANPEYPVYNNRSVLKVQKYAFQYLFKTRKTALRVKEIRVCFASNLL